MALFLLGLLYHFFAFALNDIVDLELDRRNPGRRLDPMIRGVFNPKRILPVVLTTVPVSHLLIAAWFKATIEAHILLALSFGLMALYNVYGKKGTVPPPITEGVYGVAIALLCIEGALLSAQPFGPSVNLTAAFLGLQLLLVNGVDGHLKNLDTDLAGGVCTLPIWLGVRIKDGIVTSTTAFRAYGVLLQGLSVTLLAVMVFRLMSLLAIWEQIVAWLLSSVLGMGMLIDTVRVLWESRLHRLRNPICPHAIFASILLCMVLWLSSKNNLVFATFIFGFVTMFALRYCLGRHMHALAERISVPKSQRRCQDVIRKI